MEKIKRLKNTIPAPRPTHFHKLSMTPMVWNVSTGQPGLSAWLCSLPALQACSWAGYEKLEEVLDITATTKTISVSNILLLLNPKHSSYWGENECYPNWNQDNHLTLWSNWEIYLCKIPGLILLWMLFLRAALSRTWYLLRPMNLERASCTLRTQLGFLIFFIQLHKRISSKTYASGTSQKD